MSETVGGAVAVGIVIVDPVAVLPVGLGLFVAAAVSASWACSIYRVPFRGWYRRICRCTRRNLSSPTS